MRRARFLLPSLMVVGVACGGGSSSTTDGGAKDGSTDQLCPCAPVGGAGCQCTPDASSDKAKFDGPTDPTPGDDTVDRHSDDTPAAESAAEVSDGPIADSPAEPMPEASAPDIAPDVSAETPALDVPPDVPEPDMSMPDTPPEAEPSCAPASDEAGDVVMQEIYFGGTTGFDYAVLKNRSAFFVSLTGWFMCGDFTYKALSGMLAPGATMKVSATWDMGFADSVGLYRSSSFSSPSEIVDFAMWNAGGKPRAITAAMAGIWPDTDVFIDAVSIGGGESLYYDGLCNSPTSYSTGPKSP